MQKWQSLAAELDKAANGKFGKSIVSKGELKTEIISGNNDVVLIIAHSNGLKLAIGNESISIDDIKSWEKTTIPSGRQRVAIMLVCDAANPHLKRGLFRRLESFTELLVGKGYFDMIIAPDHEINGNEAVKVLSEIIANKTLAEIRTLFPGWTGFVIINSVNKYNLISLK